MRIQDDGESETAVCYLYRDDCLYAEKLEFLVPPARTFFPLTIAESLFVFNLAE